MKQHEIKFANIILQHQSYTFQYSFPILSWQKLMINESLNSAAKLQMALVVADAFLSALPKDTAYQNFELR